MLLKISSPKENRIFFIDRSVHVPVSCLISLPAWALLPVL